MIKNSSSTRQAIACVLLVLSAVASSASQTNSGKSATASISGKVTIKNKGVPGIIVVAYAQDSSGERSTYRDTTDQTGAYKIVNVPAGTYAVTPMAPWLAPEDELKNNFVVMSEGEAVEGVDIAMIHGGVITGRVSDADGKPLIEESVTLHALDSAVIRDQISRGLYTDDRGVYRAFGLRPGKYKVSVGQEYSVLSGQRQSYRKTFYPSVVDAEKATVIEVTEGSETKDVNVVVGRPLSTFKVSGRIIDAETGKPLPNIRYGLNQKINENSSHSMIGRTGTNVNGEFKLENVLPGNYSVYVFPEASSYRGDSVSFEVVDHDVTDLLIKAGIGATLSGVVVFEAPQAAPVDLRGLYINAWVQSQGTRFHSSFHAPVNPDGSFKITGMEKGIMHFRFGSRSNATNQMAIARVERDGITQPEGVTVKDGEQITGVRLVVKYRTGAIHGQVKLEGDELPPNSRISVWLTRIDDNRMSSRVEGNPAPQLDTRRRFVVEGLAAGTYEVSVAVFEPNRTDTQKLFTQQVTVADNAVSEVTVIVKTKP